MILDFNLYWQKIKNDDEDALRLVYKASFSHLVKYACEITRNPEAAEEIVQDVFLHIWQNRSFLSINLSFRAYLFHSVHNHALNIIRWQKTRKESVNKLTSEETWKFITDTYDLDNNFIETIFSGETEEIINNAIKELPEQCQRIFCMSRFRSMKNSEIASQLCLSENTVKSHIYNALQKIAAAIKLGR